MGSRSSKPAAPQQATAFPVSSAIAQCLHAELSWLPRELAGVIGDYAETIEMRWARDGEGIGFFTVSGKRDERLINANLHGWQIGLSREPLGRMPRRWAVQIVRNKGAFDAFIGSSE